MSVTPATTPATAPLPPAAPLDLQQLYGWLLADGMIRKTDVKEMYAHSQGILKNAAAACIRCARWLTANIIGAPPINC
jgi:general secretion pathway protein E